MATFKALAGNKPEQFKFQIKNTEAVALEQGTPVVFRMNGTDDGIAVVLPATAGAALATTLLAGIVCDRILPGRYGNSQFHGYSRRVRVTRLTRANSTDPWASHPAYAVGDRFVVDTANNAMSRSDSGGQGTFQNYLIAAETLAASASAASTTSDTRTAITGYMKAYIRMM